jgi:hypothetical protein
VTWDSAQFLFEGDHLTALIDFELAHVGDAYMDLAPLRSRDTIEPFGGLTPAFAAYERLTGESIDYNRLRYFEIQQLTATLMLQHPVLASPDGASDYVTHLMWYVESARYAFDVMAELSDVELPVLAPPPAQQSRHAPAYAHLVRSLRTASEVAGSAGNEYERWRARCDYRLARHLQRVDEIGIIGDADLDEIAALTGSRPRDIVEADDALVSSIGASGPERDAEFLELLARRMQRLHMSVGPPDSLVARHPPLQPLPDRS